jgi:hypothetical protein
MTLVEFLEARLAEDEIKARAAGESVGYSWTEHEQVIARGGKPEGSNYLSGIWTEHDDEAPHIARHDPARVLREVAAKQAIMATVLPCPACLKGIRCVPHDVSAGASTWRPATARDEHALKLLAAIYSNHPDYRKEWRP